jgi:hypothetical protein
MDYKKLLNYRFSFKDDIADTSKWPLLIAILTSAISLTLFYFIFNVYGNYDVHAAGNARYDALMQERQHLNHDLKSLLKDNQTYLSNLEAAPQTKSELANALTKLVADNKLKLVKLNTNDSAPNSKDATLVIEAEGSYAQVSSFTQAINAKVASSEVEVLKVYKLKDKGLLHLTLGLKFATPPHLKASKISANNQAFNSSGRSGLFDGWQLIKTGFVQVPPENQASEPPINNEATPKKDPFQAPEMPAAENKNGSDKKEVSAKTSGFFLSGIMYSKKVSLCVITLPTGESKVFTTGEKINTKLSIQAIARDYVVIGARGQFANQIRAKRQKNKASDTEQNSTFHTNPERQKTLHVGEEISL